MAKAKSGALAVPAAVASAVEHSAMTVVTSATIQEFDPSVIVISERLDKLRDRTSDDYKDEIMNLAQVILEEGQIQAAVVTDSPEGPMLVAGQRRLEAIKFLRTIEGQDLLNLSEDDRALANATMFRAEMRTDLDDAVILRMAMLENVQRRNFTPLDLANDIKYLRKELKQGDEIQATTETVAWFLGVSEAQVTQHERLLKAPASVLEGVKSGKLSMSAALEFMDVPEDKREEVAARAQQNAQAEHDKKEAARAEKQAEKDAAREAKGNGKPKKERAHNPTPKVPAFKQRENVPIQRKHVRQAAKEVAGDSVKQKAPKISELRDLIETWCGPAFPLVIVLFAEGMLKWLKGELKDKALTALLDDVADKLPAKEQERKKVEGPATVSKPAAKLPAAKPTVKHPAKKAAPTKKPPVAKKKK